MHERTPLVSLIIPSYNAAPYLPALCRSIQAQTFEDFEVLIGDDASTDGTRQAVEPFLSDRRFQLVRWERNRGVTQGTGLLLDRARGAYWGYPGADDLYEPAFLRERLAFFEAHPEVGMIHGPPILINEASVELPLNAETAPMWQLDWPERQTLGPEETLARLLQHNLLTTPSLLLRMAATRRVLPFLGAGFGFAQDWSFWILHAATGYDLGFDRRPLHRYRIVGSSLSNDPRKLGRRLAETRLVPLWALSRAASFSFPAAELWGRWRKALYALWLRRAWTLRRMGALDPAWLQVAASAYYGQQSREVSLGAELLRHAGPIAFASAREERARRHQRVAVTGLAQIDHPFFRNA